MSAIGVVEMGGRAPLGIGMYELEEPFGYRMAKNIAAEPVGARFTIAPDSRRISFSMGCKGMNEITC
jgi:hypothetical protein